MTTTKAKKQAKQKHQAKIEKSMVRSAPTARRGWIRLLDFSTSGCIPCREMSKVIEEFEHRNRDIRVQKIVLDREGAGQDKILLGEEIQSVPTLVFLRKKQQLRKIVGSVGLRALENAAVKARAAALAEVG